MDNKTGTDNKKGRAKGGVWDDPAASVGLNWLACDTCSGWEIFENSGLPGPYNEKEVNKVKFTCRHCKVLKRIDDLFKEIADVRNNKLPDEDLKKWSDVVKRLPGEIQETRENADRIEAANQRMQTEIGLVKASINTNPIPVVDTTLTATQLRQATKEIQEVEARKLNVVVSGLEEGGDDKTRFIEFCNNHHDIQVPIRDADISQIERLGKSSSSNQGRLLRISLVTQDTRRKLLTIHRNKKNVNHPNVYIRPDLTIAQQEVDKKLRMELREKGKENFCILRGKIVPRVTPSAINVDSKVTSCTTSSTVPVASASSSSSATTTSQLNIATTNLKTSSKGKAILPKPLGVKSQAPSITHTPLTPNSDNVIPASSPTSSQPISATPLHHTIVTSQDSPLSPLLTAIHQSDSSSAIPTANHQSDSSSAIPTANHQSGSSSAITTANHQSDSSSSITAANHQSGSSSSLETANLQTASTATPHQLSEKSGAMDDLVGASQDNDETKKSSPVKSVKQSVKQSGNKSNKKTKSDC